MKIFKKIGKVLLFIIIALLVIALVVPKNFTVSQSLTINKPKQQVYDYVKILDNQKYYSVWVMKDPNLVPTYVGTDGTVGVQQSWNSKIDGEGMQEITKLTNDSICVDIHFKRPMQGDDKGVTIIKSLNENQTTIISEFYGHNNYPLNLMNLLICNMLKTDMTKNLNNIKNILEKQ